MSKLMIRGGYGEHGRSCFLVEYDDRGSLYMVDCGILDTDPSPYPEVSEEELGRVRYLFLTHCHKDHSGAFSHFCERGFRGTLVTTRMTCFLTGIDYDKTVFLDYETNPCRRFEELTVRYGRTGHCPGGLWFEIDDRKDTLLFSGDYQEDTLVYLCDPIRDSHAKLAVIDCAHGETRMNAKELRAQLVQKVTEKRRDGKRVILPVPQFGRGLELYRLVKEEFPDDRVRTDRAFREYAEKMLSESAWYDPDAYQMLKAEVFDVMEICEEPMKYQYDILLLADTHLKEKKNEQFVRTELENGACVLVNGRVKPNGPVGKLLREKKAERFLFPHHQSRGDLEALIDANCFSVVLPFHNEEKEVLI